MRKRYVSFLLAATMAATLVIPVSAADTGASVDQTTFVEQSVDGTENSLIDQNTNEVELQNFEEEEINNSSELVEDNEKADEVLENPDQVNQSYEEPVAKEEPADKDEPVVGDNGSSNEQEQNKSQTETDNIALSGAIGEGTIENTDPVTNEQNNNSTTTIQQTTTTQTINYVEGTTSFDLDAYSLVYTGSERRPNVLNVKVTTADNKVTALDNTKYDVIYTNNINAGTATVEVKGKAGTEYEKCYAKKEFAITKANQALKAKATKPKLKYGKKGKITVSGAYGKVTYTSSNKKLLVVTKAGVYKAKKTGTVKVTVKAAGDNNYNPASAVVKVKITGKNIKASKVKLNKKSFEYNGKSRRPKITIKYKKKKLKRGRDYKLKFENDIMPGKASVKIIGIGTFSGEITKKYVITKAKNTAKIKLSEDTIALKKSAKITVKKPIGAVTYESSDSKIAAVTKKGVVKAVKKGKCNIIVKVAGNATHKAVKKVFPVYIGYYDLSKCSVKLSGSPFIYTGSEIKPAVKVKYKNKKLVEGKDYTLTYKNNTNAGKATITVAGKGDSINQKEVTFTIHKAAQTGLTGPSDTIKTTNGSTFDVPVSGGVGKITFSTDYPSYVKNLGNGKFQATKKTKNYVTVIATAEGDENHKSKSVEIKVHID